MRNEASWKKVRKFVAEQMTCMFHRIPPGSPTSPHHRCSALPSEKNCVVERLDSYEDRVKLQKVTFPDLLYKKQSAYLGQSLIRFPSTHTPLQTHPSVTALYRDILDAPTSIQCSAHISDPKKKKQKRQQQKLGEEQKGKKL